MTLSKRRVSKHRRSSRLTSLAGFGSRTKLEHFGSLLPLIRVGNLVTVFQLCARSAQAQRRGECSNYGGVSACRGTPCRRRQLDIFAILQTARNDYLRDTMHDPWSNRNVYKRPEKTLQRLRRISRCYDWANPPRQAIWQSDLLMNLLSGNLLLQCCLGL